MNDQDKKVLAEFISLIEKFVNSEINAQSFEKEYLVLWRRYRDTDEAYSINANYNDALDKLFTSIDAFCSDPALRDENDIGEEELRVEAHNALKILQQN